MNPDFQQTATELVVGGKTYLISSLQKHPSLDTLPAPRLPGGHALPIDCPAEFNQGLLEFIKRFD